MLCFGFLELNDHNLNEYKLCAVKKKSGITKTNSLILIDFKFVKINPQSTCFHTFVDVELFKVMLDTFRKKVFFFTYSY